MPGITRDSILKLAVEKGIPVDIRKVAVTELYEAHEKGLLEEAFGTGTAAVISPVGELSWNEQTIIVNNNEIGPVSQMFYDTLVGIQRQRIQDNHGWTTTVPRY